MMNLLLPLLEQGYTMLKRAFQQLQLIKDKLHDGTSTRTISTKTSDGLAAIQAQLNNLGREIKKVNEKVFAAQVGCELCKGRHYTKDFPLKEEGKTPEEAYYTQFGVPFPQGGQYRAASLGFYQRNNANPSYQERRQSIKESLIKFMTESMKRHKENSNLIKEIRASINVAIRNQGASIKTLEIQIGQMSKSISTTVDADLNPIRRIGLRRYAVSDLQDRASVSVMSFSTYTNLGLGELAHTKLTVELADRIVKHPKCINENVLVGIERMELDLEARLMRETLILNRLLDPLYEDYIELNDLNEPLELRRNQVNDLKPTIEEGEVVDKPMIDVVKTRNDNNMVNRIYRYPSYCDFDRKIYIDYAYNLQFSCMIGFEHVNDNFFPILSVNVMSKMFYNSIMKDKVEYNGRNVLGTFVNAPIFVGNFSVVTDFTVVENMDAYRDEGMREVIVGEPFCKDSHVKPRRFDGMITILNGEHDKMNGISHSYQKLKGFYKGILDLGPEFIQDEKVVDHTQAH
ncbi:hypothetical protein Tco_1253503 [Tanacetum coccineum]